MSDISSDLLFWLEMDEGSGNRVADQSGNIATGTLLNCSWVNDATRGWSVSFNGTTSAIVARLPSFNTAGFTLACWVKVDAGMSIAYNPAISVSSFGDNTWSDPYCIFQLSPAWGFTSPLYPFIMIGYTSSQRPYALSTTAVSTGTWAHIAGVFVNTSGSMQCKIYVNGSLISTGTAITGGGNISDSLGSPAGDLVIGHRADVTSGNTSANMKGLIQGARGYTRGLVDDDVAALYNYSRTSPGILPTLIHRYLLDEGSGTTATDAEGNQNGVIVDGTWVTNDSKFGTVLSLNGTSSYIRIPNNAYLSSLVSQVSVSLWVKPDASINLANTSTLFSKPKSVSTWTTPYCSYLARASNGPDGEHEAAYYSDLEGDVSYAINSTTQIPVDTWSHIVFTLDPDDGSVLYMNASSIVSHAKYGTWPVMSRYGTDLYIGNTGSSAKSEFFKGLIHDVRVTAYGFSPTEVTALYNEIYGIYSSKENLYAVLRPPEGVSVDKSNLYAALLKKIQKYFPIDINV